MSRKSRRRELKYMGRLARQILRYWRIPLVLLVFTTMYTAGAVGQAFIGKVLLDDVLVDSRSRVSMRFETLVVLDWGTYDMGGAEWSVLSARDWLRKDGASLTVTGGGRVRVKLADHDSVIPFHEGTFTAKEIRRIARAIPPADLAALLTEAYRAAARGDLAGSSRAANALEKSVYEMQATEGALDVALSENVLGNERWEILRLIGWLSLVIAFLTAIGNFGKEYLVWHLNVKVLTDIRTQVCHHVLRLPLRFFHENRTGELMSRVTNDTASLQKAVGFLIADLVQHPIRIAGAFATAIFLSWQLALVIFLCFPILVIPIMYVGRILRKQAARGLENAADIMSLMQQMFTGIWIIKAFRLEGHQDREFEGEMERFRRIGYRWIGWRSLGRSFIEFMYVAGSALLLVLGGYVIVSGLFSLSLGTLVAFSACVVHIYTPAKALARSYEGLQEALAGADRVFALMDVPLEEPDDDRGAARLAGGVESGLSFEGIAFAYNPGVPVLHDISFDCKKGSVTAIVGRTGSGKSTLFSLLLRFFQPDRGRIAIDGRDLSEFDRASVRDHIAVVGQDPFLFHTTIRENIRLGRLDATEEEIVAAARSANIHKEIVELKEGYATVVGERGAKLSGGQRQRLTIARAFLKNAPILLLDEATSSLDSESEKHVQAALETLMKGRTTLVIAHRLSTVRNADQIVLLEDGRIVERGTHAELVAQDGVYANLARLNEMIADVPEPAAVEKRGEGA